MFATVGVGVLLVNAIRAMRQVTIPLWASHIGLDGAIVSWVLAVAVGLGNGMSSGVVMTLGADHAPPASRASFLGTWRLVADVGGFGGPALRPGRSALDQDRGGGPAIQ